MKVGPGTVTTALVVGALVGVLVTTGRDDGGVTLEQVTPVSTPAESTSPPVAIPQETTTTTTPVVAPQPIITAIPPHVQTTTQEPEKAPLRASAEKETTVSENEPEKAQDGAPGSGSLQWTDVETIAPDTVTAKGYGAPAPTLPPVPTQPDPPTYDGP